MSTDGTQPESMAGHFAEVFAKTGRRLATPSGDASEVRRWQGEARAKLRELVGMDRLTPCDLAPRLDQPVELPDHIRQRVVIRTEPDVEMPLYVLLPKSVPPPWTAVLALHGHCGGGKAAVAGVRDNPAIASAIDVFNYDYGVQLVREGFIVFCPDARGMGERREPEHAGDPLAASCFLLAHMSLPLGGTVAGMWAWDVSRLIDYVQARADCLGGPIGCVGLSGGGLQTLYSSALDERIAAAVISGYMYGFAESLIEQAGNCPCNFVPHLYEYFDCGDIAALIAPRPLVVETGDSDPLNGRSGLGNVRPQAETIRRAYEALGAGNDFRHVIFEGEHRWHGEVSIPFIKRHLTGGPLA